MYTHCLPEKGKDLTVIYKKYDKYHKANYNIKSIYFQSKRTNHSDPMVNVFETAVTTELINKVAILTKTIPAPVGRLNKKEINIPIIKQKMERK